MQDNGAEQGITDYGVLTGAEYRWATEPGPLTTETGEQSLVPPRWPVFRRETSGPESACPLHCGDAGAKNARAGKEME
jgi:hypothetical protein